MFAQNTLWSSGELSATPSTVTLMRLPAAPRMRMYAGPTPVPVSLHARMPGVREKRNGSSLPVVEKFCNSDFRMLATANGEFFCARTALTTTSLSWCTFTVSTFCSASACCAHRVHTTAIATPLIFFILVVTCFLCGAALFPYRTHESRPLRKPLRSAA